MKDQEVDSTKAFAVKEEVEARRKIKADFWEKRKKRNKKLHKKSEFHSFY
ncbi:MAG: hypothetical protein R2837_09760 [Aliarcobacter sp.]